MMMMMMMMKQQVNTSRRGSCREDKLWHKMRCKNCVVKQDRKRTYTAQLPTRPSEVSQSSPAQHGYNMCCGNYVAKRDRKQTGTMQALNLALNHLSPLTS
mmetsp:Transcript_1769/g.3213  ORF Transcript_1769/g.3213 Transcript_1769/m.3213 type:complete len:100 (-) Transcript_1769:1626-1925(-)